VSILALALGRAVQAFPASVRNQHGTAVSDLVGRAQAGDQDAFASLYRTHVGRVHALCLRMAGDSQAAADLTQDVFIRAWEALPGFRGDSALGSWLHRLAVNVFLGHKRSSTRREKRVVFAAEPGLLERPREAGSPGLTMDLEQAIAALPERARLVFVLHDVEGYQHGEIAEMAGIATGTSKAQLFRARRLLRESLER
jgi:RNA polymerase sigma-70 factor (ECF subfamily)